MLAGRGAHRTARRGSEIRVRRPGLRLGPRVVVADCGVHLRPAVGSGITGISPILVGEMTRLAAAARGNLPEHSDGRLPYAGAVPRAAGYGAPGRRVYRAPCRAAGHPHRGRRGRRVTPRSLQYAFPRHYGTTIMGYLRRVRWTGAPAIASRRPDHRHDGRGDRPPLGLGQPGELCSVYTGSTGRRLERRCAPELHLSCMWPRPDNGTDPICKQARHKGCVDLFSNLPMTPRRTAFFDTDEELNAYLARYCSSMAFDSSRSPCSYPSDGLRGVGGEHISL